MRKTTKQEKLMKLGRKRQSFGSVLAEKLIPAVITVAVICIIAAVVLHGLLIVYMQEIQMSDFYMQMNAITQNMSVTETALEDYDKELAFYLYSGSSNAENGDYKNAFRLYKQDREIMTTKKCGFAVVLSDTADRTPMTLCYADPSCFDEAYERLAKYKSKSGIGKGEWYMLIADTIYADTEKGTFVPGKMYIQCYSYDRLGQPPASEIVESFDITPADISGLTEYKENRFIGGTVMGTAADDNVIETLDKWDKKNKNNGQISKSTSTSVYWEYKNVQKSWFRENIYVPDGTMYTVTAVYSYDFFGLYIKILLVFCAVLMV